MSINYSGTEFFSNVFYVASIAAGTANQLSIQLDTDADFEWVKTEFFADIAGAVQTVESQVVPLCSVQLVDGGSNRQLFSRALPIATIAGPAGQPYLNVVAKVFAAGSSIQLNLANYSAATTYANVYLVLHGRKLFR